MKYPELNKFYMSAKLTKLKLIKHFAHVTLVTMKYSRSTVLTSMDNACCLSLVGQSPQLSLVAMVSWWPLVPP